MDKLAPFWLINGGSIDLGCRFFSANSILILGALQRNKEETLNTKKEEEV